MLPVVVALLLAQPLPAAELAAAEAQDAPCIVVFGYIGSRAAPDQADAAARAIPYFVGKLRARNPALDIAQRIISASQEAKASNLDARAELAKCQADLSGGLAALARVRGALAR